MNPISWLRRQWRRFALRVVQRGELERDALLIQRVQQGKNCHIREPQYIKFPDNVFLGDEVFFNAGATILAHAKIAIGDYSAFGPNVMLLTSGHLIGLSDIAFKRSETKLPITIGKNCWVGAGAIVLGGVEIGDGAVIGAGSIVTKSIGAWKIAVGSPCREIRDRVLVVSDPPDPVE